MIDKYAHVCWSAHTLLFREPRNPLNIDIPFRRASPELNDVYTKMTANGAINKSTHYMNFLCLHYTMTSWDVFVCVYGGGGVIFAKTNGHIQRVDQTFFATSWEGQRQYHVL